MMGTTRVSRIFLAVWICRLLRFVIQQSARCAVQRSIHHIAELFGLMR